jgi:hypothetical protein
MNTKIGDKTFEEWYDKDYVPIRGADEGEGASGASEEGSSALDEGLFPGIDKVPAEYRQHIDPILKEVEKNANSRIGELSEKTKAWEPYEQLGVNQIEPEVMEGMLGLLELMSNAEDDPSGFQEWWKAVGDQYGFAGEGEGEGEGDEFLEEAEENGLSAEDIAEVVKEQVQGLINPFLEEQQSQKQEQLLQQADQTIDEQISALKKEHGDFDEKVEAAICKFALAHEGPDAIEKGFEDYKNVVEEAQGQLFTKKTQQPGKPEGPGTPNTTPDKITDFKSANAAARARLEAQNQS